MSSDYKSRIKPSVFSFGRRTGIEVLKGKKVRKRKDGTDVFDDYWTDSECSVSNINEKDQTKNKSISYVMNKSQNSKIKGLISESSSDDNSDNSYMPSPQVKSRAKNASKAHIINLSPNESNVNPNSIKKRLNFGGDMLNTSNKNAPNSIANLNKDIVLNDNENDQVLNDDVSNKDGNQDVLNEDENKDASNEDENKDASNGDENEDVLNDSYNASDHHNLNMITSTPKISKNKASVKKLIPKKINTSNLMKSSSPVEQINTKQNQSMNKNRSKTLSFNENLINQPDKEKNLSLGTPSKMTRQKNASNISNHLSKASTSQALLNSSLQNNSKHMSRNNQVFPSNKNNSKIKINKISTKINIKKKTQNKLNTKKAIRRSPRKNKQVSYFDKRIPQNSVIHKDGLEIEYSPVDESPITNAVVNFENTDTESHQNNNDDDDFETIDENGQNENAIDNADFNNSDKMQNIARPNKSRKVPKTQIKKSKVVTKTQIKKSKNKNSLLKTSVSNESDNPRRSNRRRFPPLAHWRNERARYKFLTLHDIEFIGIEQGSSFTTNNNKKVNKPKKNQEKNSFPSNIQYPVLDITVHNPQTQENNKAQIVKPFSCLNWVDTPSRHYSITKLFETQDVSYGFLKIQSMQKKNLQYLPDDDLIFCLIKGAAQVHVFDTTFLVKEKDSFLVPQGNAYEISNIKKEEAIFFYSTVKYSFLNDKSYGV